VSEHRYAAGAIRADYARAGIGLALTALPLVLVPAGSVGFWILGVLAALFLAFGWRTLRRQQTRIAVDDDAVSILAPGRARLAWRDVGQVKLSYYSTKMDRAGGWMQLQLKPDPSAGSDGRAQTIVIDSTLDDFLGIARRAADAAEARRVPLSPSTVANFAAIGIAVTPPEPEA